MSLTEPNKAEAQWLDDIVQLGCVICWTEGNPHTPAEAHHMLEHGRRMGHLFTIPLCFLHHRAGRNDRRIVSRGQSQTRFEERYGPEVDLLAATQRLVLCVIIANDVGRSIRSAPS